MKSVGLAIAKGVMCLCGLLPFSVYAADEVLRDPMQPAREALVQSIGGQGQVLSLTLEGIRYLAQGRSSAIINGELVYVGSLVGEYVVLGIRPNEVQIRKEQTVEVLKLSSIEKAFVKSENNTEKTTRQSRKTKQVVHKVQR